MKKFVLTLIAGLFISIASFAQAYPLTVYGTVMMTVNNTIIPVANQPVTVRVDSTGFGFTYENTVYTDNLGYYEDVVEIPGFNGYGYVSAQTYDTCLGYDQYQSQFIAPGSTLAPMDFFLCNSYPPDCYAFFTYYIVNPADPLTVSFYNQSLGNITDVFWSFGDSIFSTEMNPVHTFAGPGTYYVCLTINGSDCSDTFCEMVVVGDIPGGCESYFYYTYNEPFSLTFEGFLTNGQYAQYYSWDFGDGTYGTGQTVTHSYSQQGPGVYMVSLTTMVYNQGTMDSCMYTSYQEVWIQNQPGCNAYFNWFPDSLSQTAIQFIDLSYGINGNQPDSWYWEFGDGTTSALQNPIHTYADTGRYYVCLMVGFNADSCTSSFCQDVFAGIMPPPPGGCESFILPINISGLTVDFEGYTVSPFETQYTWEFGDGVTGTGQYISHTYGSTGMYNVTLNTVDAMGCTFQTFTQIWLDSTNQGGCSNYYTYEQTDSNTFIFNGIVYYNNGIIYPDSSTVYSWDFGDGTFGSGQTVTHYFQQNPAGGYTVCLTTTSILSDGTACTAIYCEYINLVAPAFNIFGFVGLGNNLPADQGIVHLMTMDTLWQGVVEVQSTTIDSGGYYNFPDVPMYNSRIYYIQAELSEGSAHFGEYIPTYHLSALTWEQAEPVLPLMNWPADIFMIPATEGNSGNGMISGIVTNLGARANMEDVEVVMMDADKNPIRYLHSDSQGMFTFGDLALGTYVIHAEIVGVHTVQAEVTLTEQKPEATVEVQVNGNEANIVFGIPEPTVIDKVGEIYPNPARDEASVEITLNKASSISARIIGVTGQQVVSRSETLAAGTHRLVIEMESLPEGLYVLQIVTGNGEIITRKLIKE